MIAFGGGNDSVDSRISREVLELSLVVVTYEREFAYYNKTEPRVGKVVDRDYPARHLRTDGEYGYVVSGSNYRQFIGVVNITMDDDGRVVEVDGSPMVLDHSIHQGGKNLEPCLDRLCALSFVFVVSMRVFRFARFATFIIAMFLLLLYRIVEAKAILFIF